MTKKLYIFLFLTACTSSHKELSGNEKNYNAISDSLVKYKNEIKACLGSILPTMSDYMKMDYASYKSKYKLSDKEMNDLAQTFTISYQVARTKKEIESNMSIMTNSNKADSMLKELNKNITDYTFNAKDTAKNNYESSTSNDKELKILMDAYDSDKQSEKKKN